MLSSGNLNILKESVDDICRWCSRLAHDDGDGVLVADNGGITGPGSINYEIG